MDSASTITALAQLAQRARALVGYRRAALQHLGAALPFDAALFHEMSPRVPLSRAALVGLDPEARARSRATWDGLAVQLGRLRDLVLEQDGVAADHDAFAPGSRARAAFEARVARPLGVRSLLMAHLTFDERIVSAVLLFRRGGARFSDAEQRFVRALVPVLTIGDVTHQLASARPLRGAAARVRCVDQRLTPRQRELVERVALGHTNDEIGRALGLSANTVRNLLVEARRRVDAANRAELVRVAVLR
jgi:DNA-binding CsgD family transcriptional regulator